MPPRPPVVPPRPPGPQPDTTHHMNDTAVGAGGLGAEDRRAWRSPRHHSSVITGRMRREGSSVTLLILSSSSRLQHGRVVIGVPRARRAHGKDLGHGPANGSNNVVLTCPRAARRVDTLRRRPADGGEMKKKKKKKKKKNTLKISHI